MNLGITKKQNIREIVVRYFMVFLTGVKETLFFSTISTLVVTSDKSDHCDLLKLLLLNGDKLLLSLLAKISAEGVKGHCTLRVASMFVLISFLQFLWHDSKLQEITKI